LSPIGDSERALQIMIYSKTFIECFPTMEPIFIGSFGLII